MNRITRNLNQKGNSLIIVFLVVILIGIVMGGYYLWQKNEEDKEMSVQPFDSMDIEDEETIMSTTPTNTSNQPNNWITYTNDNFNYSISYPKEFKLSDQCYDAQTNEFMDYDENPQWLVIIDKNMDDNFPYCESDFPQMDIIVKAYDQEIDINERMEESDTDIEDEVKIGDNVWARQIMSEPSIFDDTYATYLFLNKDGKGYEIDVKNIDANGSHNKIIDQIIETFNLN